MNAMINRFLEFAKTEKTRRYWAIALYFCFIILSTTTVPTGLRCICNIISVFVYILTVIYFAEYCDKIIPLGKDPEDLLKDMIEEIKKVFKELLMYIPFWLLVGVITSIFIVGTPENQRSINETFEVVTAKQSTLDFITLILLIVIFGPIMEEFIFRVLPYKFIKNKTVYIIFSSVVFAAMHVVDDPNAFYYIGLYIIRPFYYAYRYHKTKDFLVPVSMHIFNNLMATIPVIIAFFA